MLTLTSVITESEFIFLMFIYSYFMCTHENACVYVRYVCARCLGKPGDGAESSSTVVIVSCGFWEPKAGPLQEEQMP